MIIRELVGTAIPAEREDILALAASALRSPARQAVYLVAEPGMGKSALVNALRAELDTEFHIVRLQTSSALSAVPYGILAPLLGTGSSEVGDVPMEMLRAFLANFEGVSGAKLMVVDDADELDEATTNLLVELVSSRWAKLLISYQPKPGVARQLNELWYEGLAERFDLPALEFPQAHRLLEQQLDGILDEASAQMLWRASEGNPWYLRCFLDDLRAGGGLVEYDGLWMLSSTGMIPGSGVDEAVHSILLRCTLQQRETLNLVALAEPALRTVVEKVMGVEVVTSLLEDRLLKSSGVSAEYLVLSQLFLAEALRQMIPVTRSLHLHQQYVSLLRKRPASAESLLGAVKWALDCGLPVSDQELLKAALLAARMDQNDYCLRAAKAVRGAEHGFRVRALIARAELNAGKFSSALKRLQQDFLAATTLADLLDNTLLWASCTLAVVGKPEELCAAAEKLQQAGRDLAAVAPENAPEILQATTERSSLLRMMAAAHAGDYQRGEKLIAELEHRYPDPRRLGLVTRVFCLAFKGEHLLALGKFNSCMNIIAKALRLVSAENEEIFDLRGHCHLLYSRAAINSGNWQRANIPVEDHSEERLSLVSSAAGLNSSRGIVLLRQGRAAEASALLRGTLEQARQRGGWMFPRVAASGYYAATLAGKAKLAALFRAEADHALDKGSEMTQLVAGFYLGLGREFAERSGEGINELRALAERARGKKLYGLELYALLGCLELGSDQEAARAVELVEDVEGDWLAGWGKYAQAVLSAEPRAFQKAGEFLFQQQIYDIAAISFSRAVELFGVVGNQLARQQCLDLLTETISQLGSAAPIILKNLRIDRVQVSLGIDTLTARERMIVAMAAEGASNREIASSLCVSIRTVEGHLYRSYAKLGIPGREKLPRVETVHGFKERLRK